MSLNNRTFLRWDEAAQLLGMDREGLRQALLYQWSPTGACDKHHWLPVMLTLPGREYTTHFAMHIAHALATGGSFLRWDAATPVPVLYVDGEMPAPDMQARWRALFEAYGEPGDGMLRVVSRDLQPFNDMPNLADADGQQVIGANVGKARVVILDNLSSLI